MCVCGVFMCGMLSLNETPQNLTCAGWCAGAPYGCMHIGVHICFLHTFLCDVLLGLDFDGGRLAFGSICLNIGISEA